MIVAGVMSGTSADGINVALVRIQGRGFRSRLELLAHYEFPYPPEVRRAVLQAMNAPAAKVADLARLNFTLGTLYANAVRAAQRRAKTGVRTRGLPRSNDISPGYADSVSRPSRRVHLANRRERDHRRHSRRAGRLRLSPR